MPQLTVRDIFIDCQDGLRSHGKLVKSLSTIYNATPFDVFWEEFVNHLKYSMVIFQRESAVECTIHFVTKFGAGFVSKDSGTNENDDQENEDEESDLHPFLLKLFDFLLESHNANNKAVRFRVCQLMNKLLNDMGEGAQIDDDLYDRIYECMFQRLRDQFPVVRVHAVLAMTRLQDPTDQDCPVISAFLFLLNCDISSDVRRAVLSVIAASTKTLPAIIEHTRDVKDTVRKLAYQIIAKKIHIKALTIAQRVKLLETGLKDRSQMVQDACSMHLLQAWLRTFEGNILELLNCLDVENSEETVEKTLVAMFKKAPVTELMDNFDVLDEMFVIPKEKLMCENVLYWRCLCQYIASLGLEGEQLLERLLPSVSGFSSFLRSVFDGMKIERDIDAQLSDEFIMRQLLKLANILDLSDEAGRKQFGRILFDMLSHECIPPTLVAPLLACYKRYQQEPEARVQQIVEIISDIRQPITTVEHNVSADERRKIDLKLAGVRVELNEMREELEVSVQKQEFERAASLKARVSELEENKHNLLNQTVPSTQEVRTDKNDAETLLKCTTIAAEMLRDEKINKLMPTIQTMMETLIIPSIQSEDPAVRNMAVKALGLCCLLNKETAKNYLLLLIQISQMDEETIRVAALAAIFDILLLFGVDTFDVDVTLADAENPLNTSDNNNDATNTEQGEDGANRANNIMTVLMGRLDDDASDVRTIAAEGLAKLLQTGRIISAGLLSRLMLLWYNPLTVDDTKLRHCIGTFLPIYSFTSRANQEVMGESMMKTLHTLFGAPATSPLAEVNINNVVELLVQLTNARHLLPIKNSQQVTDSCVHDTIAEQVCNEILEEPNGFNTRVMCKILNSLELHPSNLTSLKSLTVLAERILQVVKERASLKLLEKFSRTVKDLIKDSQNNDENKENDPMPITTEVEATPTSRLEKLKLDIDAPQAENEDDDSKKTFPEPSPADKIVNSQRKSKKSAKKRGKSAAVEDNDTESEMENSVFVSPSPLRRVPHGRKSKIMSLESTRKNLEGLLSESESEPDNSPPAEKTHARSTRASRSRTPLSGLNKRVT